MRASALLPVKRSKTTPLHLGASSIIFSVLRQNNTLSCNLVSSCGKKPGEADKGSLLGPSPPHMAPHSLAGWGRTYPNTGVHLWIPKAPHSAAPAEGRVKSSPGCLPCVRAPKGKQLWTLPAASFDDIWSTPHCENRETPALPPGSLRRGAELVGRRLFVGEASVSRGPVSWAFRKAPGHALNALGDQSHLS